MPFSAFLAALDLAAIARAVHVAAIVHWIGGVLFVTFVVLPAVTAMAEPAERIALFERIEHRFAAAARVSVALAGLSGLYLVWTMDLWWRFLDPHAWYLHAMVAIWSVFALMLYVLEPLVLHAWFARAAARAPAVTFARIVRLHRVLSAASVVTVVAATAGAHGYLPF